MEYYDILQSQKDYFSTNNTKDINFRIKNLKHLKAIIIKNEKKLYNAIYEDIGKSEFETYETELSTIYRELDTAIKKLKKWSSKKKVKTNIVNFPAKSYIIAEPLGCSLIISAWNYPYQLSLIPSISAIAAGNTVILKPSELAPKTSEIIAEIINNSFPKNYFHVIEGAVKETKDLLSLRYDKIFFTGSTEVGKLVHSAASQNLTPVTLELGGKSPAFILDSKKINITAQRIAWAKFLNAGQTCVAPDYIVIDKKIEIEFLEALKYNINKYYRLDSEKSDNYTRIINQRHFDRLSALIDKKHIFIGGNTDKENLYISPTVLRNIDFSHQIMKDEIFGPILPIITFNNLDDAIKDVKSIEKPLSLYIFSNNNEKTNKIINELSFGGCCINDAVMQLSNKNLPFGGVGHSGMGRYYGEYGFKDFSNFKSILHKSTLFEPSIKYLPYTKRKLNIIKRIL